jgi:mannose-6-phosphate isomerase-like protein (cupin superfamily)
MSNGEVRSPRLAYRAPKFCGEAPNQDGVALRMAELDPLTKHVTGGLFTVAPGATSRPDTHAVTEVWMIAQGRGVLRYAEQVTEVSQGDMLFYEPHHTHQIHNDGSEELVIYTLWWNA